MSTDADNRKQIWKLVSENHVCMMVTSDAGTMRARPMGAMAREDEGLIYFFSDRRHHTDEELAANPEACLAFADPGDNEFVSMTGKVAISNDTAKKNELWNKWAQAWFPDGPDGANVLLLAFTPDLGEYWEGSSNGLMNGIKIARAIAENRQPEMGEQGKASF